MHHAHQDTIFKGGEWDVAETNKQTPPSFCGGIDLIQVLIKSFFLFP